MFVFGFLTMIPLFQWTKYKENLINICQTLTSLLSKFSFLNEVYLHWGGDKKTSMFQIKWDIFFCVVPWCSNHHTHTHTIYRIPTVERLSSSINASETTKTQKFNFLFLRNQPWIFILKFGTFTSIN